MSSIFWKKYLKLETENLQYNYKKANALAIGMLGGIESAACFLKAKPDELRKAMEDKLPYAYVEKIEQITKGKITRRQLRPDLFVFFDLFHGTKLKRYIRIGKSHLR